MSQCFIDSDMRGTPWCSTNINERQSLEGHSLHRWSSGRLIHGQQRGHHLCRSMTCLNIQTSVQFCSYSLTCLQQVENAQRAWPLEYKTDCFILQCCAFFHLEERDQAFKCISWFKLNSATKGREIPYSGDLLKWLGIHSLSGGAEGHNLTLNLAVMGKDWQHMNCISDDRKLDFFN